MNDLSPRFYFDYLSPFAYLAWRRLDDLEQRHGLQFDRVPVLFAGILDAHGQLGPAEIPAKARWVYRHVARQAHRFGIEIRPPAFHPFNPLAALRSTLAAQAAGADADPLIDALFAAAWREQRPIGEAAVVLEIAGRAGFDGPSLMEQATDGSIKRQLRDQTAAAVADGVFGVPTFRVGEELFWGVDDMDNLDRYLAGDDPLGPDWIDHMPEPAAQRKR